MDLETPIGSIKGIGAKTEQRFHDLGVYALGDMLLHYPRNYETMPTICSVAQAYELKEGMAVAVFGKIRQLPFVRQTRTMPVTTLQIQEGCQVLSLVWFRMPYLKNTLKIGKGYVFLGKLVRKGDAQGNVKDIALGIEQAEIYPLDKYEDMQNVLWPSYALTRGLGKNLMVKTIKQVLAELDLSQDYLPMDIRQRRNLAGYEFAIHNIHFPKSEESLQEARKRLAFDEFFRFILAAQLQKRKTEQEENQFEFVGMEDSGLVSTAIKKLPYELTLAQKRTLLEIRQDLRGNKVMQRLVQGDVGSGKTIVAFLAMLDCAQSGYQSALMAPTEVLARQHYKSLTTMCEAYGIKVPVLLLTGSMARREKRRIYDRMQLYSNAIVIGTHALIQERAVFDNLALVITDEQHRFGVKQRETLFLKGASPHVLVMSATPIPRTLAIILYGDLDISIIDEVPARRLPIKNAVVGKGYRQKTYQFIRKEVEKGRQAYVICPLVEESEGLDAENVESYAKTLMAELPGASLAALHGKMNPAMKNKIMEDFKDGKIQVLVSTTVIEVGINVPNATVMVVEDAQRFGLAQLHQLRGRVGRGGHQSYCILINTSEKTEANERLDILNKSNDGFFIAAEDLKLRGPGDFFGIRQSGLLEFRLGDIYHDEQTLKAAADEAKSLLAKDPDLSDETNRNIRKEVFRYLEKSTSAKMANL